MRPLAGEQRLAGACPLAARAPPKRASSAPLLHYLPARSRRGVGSCLCDVPSRAVTPCWGGSLLILSAQCGHMCNWDLVGLVGLCLLGWGPCVCVCVFVCGRERPFMIRLHACAGMGLRAPPLLCWVTDSQPCCCGTLCCELWRQGMALAKVVTCSNKGLLWVLCSSPGACGIPRAH